MAVPALRGVASSTSNNFTAATSFATPYPATVVADDIAFLITVFDLDTTSGLTLPSGFTSIDTYQSSGVFGWSASWKRCDGSEGGGTATTTWTGAANGRSVIVVYSGAKKTGTPFEGLGITDTAGGATNLVASAAVVTTGVDRLVLHLMGVDRNINVAAPAGYTEDNDSGGNNIRIVVESIARAAAGTEASTSRDYVNPIQWATAALALVQEHLLNGQAAGSSAGSVASVDVALEQILADGSSAGSVLSVSTADPDARAAGSSVGSVLSVSLAVDLDGRAAGSSAGSVLSASLLGESVVGTRLPLLRSIARGVGILFGRGAP